MLVLHRGILSVHDRYYYYRFDAQLSGGCVLGSEHHAEAYGQPGAALHSQCGVQYRDRLYVAHPADDDYLAAEHVVAAEGWINGCFQYGRLDARGEYFAFGVLPAGESG